MNKKGGFFDGIFVMASLFVLAIIIILIGAMSSNIKDAMISDGDLTSEGEVMLERSNEAIEAFNGYFILIFIGYLVALVSLSIFIRSFPVFALISIITTLVTITLAGEMAKVWQDLSATELSTQTAQFSAINFMMNHFGLFMIVMFSILIISLFAKARQSGGATF